MQILNGTPVQINAMAEGRSYWFKPGEIKDVKDEGHARTLLNNFAAAGLRELKFGDSKEAAEEESLALWCEHIEQAKREFDQFQLDQARQGLKPSPPNRQLEDFLRIYQEKAGAPLTGLGLSAEDPMLAVIQRLAQAAENSEVPSKAARLKSLVTELSRIKAEASGLSGEDENPTTVQAVKSRRARNMRAQRAAAESAE